ncbi:MULTISPECIES: lytic polysaccharide monooxygenase auxiliary activity family 9 protein [Pseudomonas syringae group]|uniref:Lytic polysaccharide monooxygenase auxiliary activity family 9 protein n=3 Tax=Pseudomonas syringae group TaxID=136849 RepID=A0ABV4PCH8_9PSED|nr:MULTISPECIES: lytic polysaccharide monooxygenase auxiliary activity family 9 protein [Pseudomonas syringae group]KGS16231.1 chitin-binding protein [Pseudomonas coronafaciens]KOP54220.1 chitin-binding protein [Pseudomonas coronafaciens pv. porri]KOP60739.1 chitin-binding protein [Pseudomonas coronafaciens pv. porri]MCQ3014257.1 lytic polysaccharide monooxygenase [Pseudomonas tremae]QGL57167.1 chitin-binding protein [Pseudomonas coronafaciens pv. oryzae str. 1_6]
MPDSTTEGMEMNESDTARPRHGRVISPASRGSYAMEKELLLEWEVVSMEGGKNFPDLTYGYAHDFPRVDVPVDLTSTLTDPPADGLILSGGNSGRWARVNLTDNGIIEEIKKNGKGYADKWPRLSVTRGAEFKIEWVYHAEHLTRGYRWFITKEGWDESTPLTRADFKGKNYVSDNHFNANSQDGLMWSDVSDLSPFSEHRNELQPKKTSSVTLPDDKHGHHVILLAWIIAETDKAFYQAFDVDFGA